MTGTFGTVADSEATGRSAEMERPHVSLPDTKLNDKTVNLSSSVGRLVRSTKTVMLILCKKIGEMSSYYFTLYHIPSLIII